MSLLTKLITVERDLGTSDDLDTCVSGGRLDRRRCGFGRPSAGCHWWQQNNARTGRASGGPGTSHVHAHRPTDPGPRAGIERRTF